VHLFSVIIVELIVRLLSINCFGSKEKKNLGGGVRGGNDFKIIEFSSGNISKIS